MAAGPWTFERDEVNCSLLQLGLGPLIPTATPLQKKI